MSVDDLILCIEVVFVDFVEGLILDELFDLEEEFVSEEFDLLFDEFGILFEELDEGDEE